MKYRAQFNPQERPVIEGRRRPVSITIPDQSYTIQELMLKHMSGSMPAVMREGVWQNEDDVDMDELDLSTEDPSFDITDAFVHAKEIEEIRLRAQRISKEQQLPFKGDLPQGPSGQSTSSDNAKSMPQSITQPTPQSTTPG